MATKKPKQEPAAPVAVAATAVAEPVEIVVIADRSGSMESIRDDAIGGFNAFLEEQKKVEGEANLTLVLFDDKYEVPVDAMPLADVYPLTKATFVPRGMTAMNDAIGRALTALEAKNPAKAIICILTDGMENASREFDANQVKKLVTAAENRGWRVIYLAANQDAFAVGARMGVLPQNSQNFAATGAGVQSAYGSLSRSTSDYRGS